MNKVENADENESKNGWLWHYHIGNFQRHAYNELIFNGKEGEYGIKFVMLIVDWSEAYKLKNSVKLSADQFFHCSKCQILGIIEYVYRASGFHGTSNFYFSDQIVNTKYIKNVIADVKKRILERLEENPELDIIHIFSDGATNDLMTRKNFSNMIDLAEELEVTIIWHFFGPRHGKNICDPEFAKIKIKLDAVVLSVCDIYYLSLFFFYCRNRRFYK